MLLSDPQGGPHSSRPRDATGRNPGSGRSIQAKLDSRNPLSHQDRASRRIQEEAAAAQPGVAAPRSRRPAQRFAAPPVDRVRRRSASVHSEAVPLVARWTPDSPRRSEEVSRSLAGTPLAEPRHDYSDVALQPQSQGHDRNVFVSNGVPCQRRPFLWVISQPVVEYLADFLRSGEQFSRLSDSHHLERRIADRIFQAYIHEIEVEHAQECVEQGMNNLGRRRHPLHMAGRARTLTRSLLAALKALDLVGGMFDVALPCQAAVVRRTVRRAPPLAKLHSGTLSGGTKNGLCWRMPPMMIMGCVRMMSITVSPPNFERS